MNEEILLFFVGFLSGIVIISFFWSMSIMPEYKELSCEEQCKSLFQLSEQTFERLDCIKLRCAINN